MSGGILPVLRTRFGKNAVDQLLSTRVCLVSASEAITPWQIMSRTLTISRAAGTMFVAIETSLQTPWS